ncbi:YiiD C-terminal domain-containing protein [Pseudomarimonas arenosa]|uniref:YiiD C-terminal domain-containing protein n=1 Tax=Pseudomarimonas arenosa TaxID=2774145 RepID=A0AAW3ZSD1_9GAMM|nr:YiiD C-terminal domain-containing protein [Pseudomarimonas arenosa]MBD8527997.1 YiiD C-terminal domain-containing protein [Pseudomarimonas arenosa]
MNPEVECSQRLARLQEKLSSMPPVAAMQIRVHGFERGELQLMAPLSHNVNDKGSAFGGSLAGLMTLACWGSASLALARAGFEAAEVYVQDSQVRYLAPLYDDLMAAGRLLDGFSWDDFVRAFRERGKARVTLCAEVRCADGRVAASFEGRFVALRPG